MTEINLTPVQSGGCGCGCGHDAVPELVARSIPKPIRHSAILGVVDGLASGESFVLVAPHDPKRLLTEMAERFGDSVAVEYLEQEPEAWKLKLTRV